MKQTTEITNNKYGKLRAIKKVESRKGREYWLFRCDCGNEKVIRKSHVTSGATLSCGCLNKEAITKHGIGNKNNKIYRLWEGIKRRAFNSNYSQYKDYGGRGITMCEEWAENPLCFYNWCIQNGYKEGLEIDRIDNNKGYSPDNCRFTDRFTQSRNKRSNVVIECNGIKKCLMDWAIDKGIKYDTLRSRIFTYKWDIERALNETTNNH